MDAGGLGGRGIGEVDVGHDDQTTLKSGLHSILSNLLYCKPLYLLLALHSICSYFAFKVKHFRNRFSTYEVL